jgi:hypothetical protein
MASHTGGPRVRIRLPPAESLLRTAASLSDNSTSLLQNIAISLERMARRHPIAVAVKQHAGEEARLARSSVIVVLGGVAGKPGLDCIPERLIVFDPAQSGSSVELRRQVHVAIDDARKDEFLAKIAI